MIVAKNIRRLREESKLSMDELSKLSGVSKSMLAQIERVGREIQQYLHFGNSQMA